MPSGIQVEIYRDTAPHVIVEVLHARMQPSALQELKNHGIGSFLISKLDKKILDDPSLLDYRTLVRIRADNFVTSAFPIQTKKSTTVGEGEAKEETWLVSGEGVRSWFNDAQVLPARGVKKTSKENRFFNFSSERGSWYESSQWIPAVEIWQWNEPGNWWGTGPKDWPDVPQAKWIGSIGRQQYDHPIATQYFRYEFDSGEGAHSFLFSADDSAEVYVDGEQMFTNANTWQETNRVDFVLDSGPHVIGVKVANSPVGRGPSALIGALFKVGDPLVPSSAQLISHTSSAWLVNPFPAKEPGWTVGDVLITLLNEAKARGVRFPNNIAITFSVTHDSAGNLWDRSPWSFPLGAKYSEVVERLEELACDVYLDPETLALYAWKERGVDRSLEGKDTSVIPVVLRPAKDMIKADATGQADITNSLLLRTADGWSLREPSDNTSKAKYGVLEGQVSTELSDEAAVPLVKELFRQKSKPEVSTTIEIFPMQGSMPFIDFNVGDWVSAPSEETGQLLKRKVMSISTTESQTGSVRYAVEFDTIFKDRQSALESLVTRGTGTSSLGGGFASSSGTPGTVQEGQAPGVIPAARPDAPTALTVTSTGRWTELGEPTSDFDMYWNPVVSSQGFPITDVTGYEVWGRQQGQAQPQLVARTVEPQTKLLNYPSSVQWTFQVLAVSRTGGNSPLSDPVTITSERPLDPLKKPSTPTLDSDLGIVIINWDGLLGGDIAPTHYKSMRVERATSDSGPWTPATTFERVAGQDKAVTVGSKYYYRLVAVDRLGTESAPSSSASVTVKGVQPGQIAVGAVIGDNIAANAVDITKIANGAISREKLQPGAVGANEIADFALTAKKFNTGRHLIF